MICWQKGSIDISVNPALQNFLNWLLLSYQMFPRWIAFVEVADMVVLEFNALA
jgi:hypothetical protein